MPTLTEKERMNTLNQVRILALIDEPNVISYKEAFIDEGSGCLCLIMEYADNGDLF
jgi:NIMA (never in mitosis gene a)-related kinase